jgi:hypothetical protein
MKNLRLKTMLASAAIIATLTGCSSTNSINHYGSKWSNEAVFANASCSSFSFEEVHKFIQNAYVAVTLEAMTSGSSNGAEVVQNYFLSAALINRANTCIASALELTKVMADLEIERQILLGGTSIDEAQLVEHRRASKAVTQAIREKVAELDRVRPEQRKTMSIGISTFLGGTYTGVETLKDLVDLSKGTADQIEKAGDDVKRANDSGGILGGIIVAAEKTYENAAGVFSKGSNIKFISAGMKDVVEDWYKTASVLSAFAKVNDIDIPESASDYYNDASSEDEVFDESDI